MSNKHNLVLYVDQELDEKTRDKGFNLSKTFENHLKQLLMQFSHINSSNNFEKDGNVSVLVRSPGFEPGITSLEGLRPNQLDDDRPISWH
jgi:hypothetical protein